MPQHPTEPDEIAEHKRLLRKAARALRAAAARPELAGLAAEQFMRHIPMQAGMIAAGYWPQGAELDPRPLLGRLVGAGLRLALPVVAAADRPLLFRAWQPGDRLLPSAMGIPEPAGDAPLLRPDLLLVPLLAFDGQGFRLGQGGGYYDRTLVSLRSEAAPVTAIGFAMAAQEVAALPRGPFDQRLDWMVTESQAKEHR